MIHTWGLLNRYMFLILLTTFVCSCSDNRKRGGESGKVPLSESGADENEFRTEYMILISPETPQPGENFRVVTTGGSDILKATITVSGPEGDISPLKHRTAGVFPFWRVDEYRAGASGTCRIVWKVDKRENKTREFSISESKPVKGQGVVWKSRQGWDPGMEELYSAWVSALFEGDREDASWASLNEVTQRKDKNFLYNHLGLNEDGPSDDPGNNRGRVTMQPDCADNPFFLRAYFSWKLGLPFGFHVCDRGSPGRSPAAGTWETNESAADGADPVFAFNRFLRKVMNVVHSGTARTALDNDRSDYYPVPLEKQALRPGVVFADPYGHTLIITGWQRQTSKNPGRLLAVDAQPDGTIGIKRFWKGNFLFNTQDVVGEPGFKAFRPIIADKQGFSLIRNSGLTPSSGYIPYSLQQRKMTGDTFYHSMERLINPKPLDPEMALGDLIHALHEQLIVRVTSVANGEQYVRSHPGSIIPMPSVPSALFLAGGQWENFSTPNRDLRLLIAMDAVLSFPDKVAENPEDYRITGRSSGEDIRGKLQKLMEEKTKSFSIVYTASDGSSRRLTLKEILDRREAFEMAYNPNDCPEIRWGAPENSTERSTCKRKAPAAQYEKMKSMRRWFQQRLHPPT